MKVLIDNVEHTADVEGYVYGEDNTSRFSFHSVIKNHAKIELENFKVIGSGHVYVINYNKETYKEKFPLTYKEYQESKKNN